ncbi:DUF1360 domain-containing protein [Streptomyces sp. NRRL S-350]|uniref:DUF1360 domain-containing protein n=1 Tax=Streptomyces sp. NRRL S-350 TaxID=1463902 RepID=UPI0005638206|nr:DUF1360 domain-containing protein [Streptomyces sp. NRRL S-350]
MITPLRELLRREARTYSGDDDRPLAGYTGLMAAYSGAVLGAAALARAARRELPRPGPWDVTLTALATHQLSRLITKDPVTSPLRAPFTRFKGTSGPAELDEEVRGTGARKAIGELVTCPFCTSLWIATACTVGSVFAPRATRLATATLAALSVADFLQYAHAAAQDAAEGTS